MTTTLDRIQLVDFCADHLPAAVRLSQQAGWPHRAQDWALTLSQSTGVAALHEGEVVGTALVSDFGDVAALNMIIVDEGLRGRRLGRRLMDAVIARAGAREMRLIATQDGLPLYEKLGFKATGDVAQLQGMVQAPLSADGVKTDGYDLDRMIAMDRAASGLERSDLLKRISEQGQVLFTDQGFAILRDFGRGKVLGPIVAQNLETARSLLAAAAQSENGSFLRIDTPVPELGAFAQELGLDPVGGGICMVLHPQDATFGKTFQTYGLVSQALG
ncbi:GNAT family N-acetyltransferase [Pseudophaeobacter arcticus]|uniref:GNAT family N-acetyltransferase n=1 Tax=Pseudophaeobacter arcticus TaxID=385492 RepID=UPI003A97E818